MSSESKPDDIEFPEQVFEIAFHPNRNIIASGLIDGQVFLHQFAEDKPNQLMHNLNHHKRACRALQFSEDGAYLFTGAADKSLHAVDVETGVVTHSIKKAHEAPVNAMFLVNENLLATGDDEGCVKLWDIRQSRTVIEFNDNEDYIADFACHERKVLLAASGDGTLSVFSIYNRKLMVRSDHQEDELLSVAVVKGGSRVVCGSQDGVVMIFKWDEFADVNDRFLGHPNSVETIVKLTDSIIATGSSDGLIRVCNILPNKLMGLIGEHEDMPIERLRISNDQRLLASCSHDATIKFWNIADFFEEDDDDDDDDEEEDNDGMNSDLKTAMDTRMEQAGGDDFVYEEEDSDDDDSEEDSDSGSGSGSDSDSESDDGKGKPNKKGGKKPARKPQGKQLKKGKFGQKDGNFFDGL